MGNVLNEYFQKINNIYSNKGKQTLTDILNDYKILSTDYKNFVETEEEKIEYSSPNFIKCTKEEQETFFNDQLQLVECLVTNSIYEKSGIIWNWFDIFKLLFDNTYRNVEKINRKVVYSTSSNQRPIGDNSYSMWNGLQIIDLDIKNADLAQQLKTLLFEELNKYQWFLGICTSASGKSLHIWTKITPISILI